MNYKTELAAALPLLEVTDRKFGRSLLEALERWGSLTPRQAYWAGKLIERSKKAAPPAVALGQGALTSVAALLAKGGAALKYPHVVLSLPSVGEIKLSIAGPQAKVPGSVNVKRRGLGGEWYGRITQDGVFHASRDGTPDGLIEKLQRFAADPAGVAGEDGRLAGRCCFCARVLEADGSTAWGYGPICAEHYGLPWGVKAAAAA